MVRCRAKIRELLSLSRLFSPLSFVSGFASLKDDPELRVDDARSGFSLADAAACLQSGKASSCAGADMFRCELATVVTFSCQDWSGGLPGGLFTFRADLNCRDVS